MPSVCMHAERMRSVHADDTMPIGRKHPACMRAEDACTAYMHPTCMRAEDACNWWIHTVYFGAGLTQGNSLSPLRFGYVPSRLHAVTCRGMPLHVVACRSGV